MALGIEQLPHPYAKGFGDFVDVKEADIPFASLDAADICAVEITRER